ncbi:MAG: hypothetical protein JXR77_15715 [Lentisphaeria bacterium]|nr:hypothetical protein [Lentisphaeria bacterium]
MHDSRRPLRGRWVMGAFAAWVWALAAVAMAAALPGQEMRLDLSPPMVVNEARHGTPAGLVDEQRLIIGPPAGNPASSWEVPSQHRKEFPYSAYLDLGTERNLASLWLFDTHGTGDVVVSVGTPGQWRDVATYGCGAYMQWVRIPLEVSSRYLRLSRQSPGAQFTEVALYEFTPEAHRAMLERKAEEARQEAERQAALEQAREEARRRPLVEMAPYGTLSLLDEVDCALDTGHGFYESRTSASRVETVLDRPCRVLPPAEGEGAFFGYRLGAMKLLRPGAAYVLAVEYPEDVPRSMVVVNTGNETSRGFHTGATVGDAFHAKYVNNLPESLHVPLSGRWETWSLLFHLHDRFPPRGLVRGAKPRPLTPADGFDVTIAQFSARNMPLSRGAAAARIRLFEVLHPEALAAPLRLPPGDLPRRRLFWREEMSDGVIGSKDAKGDQRGIADAIEWYRHKAELMRFAGIHTFSKDLLEFGACQHWDPTPGGGNAWVHFDHTTKDLWGRIVELMAAYGFDILPYYEYSGSRGDKGLGYERRCRPLTRDDAYTHIRWIENANADITDPATYDDFRRILDLTILRYTGRAPFAGAWIRPRSQLPVSFGDGALERFAGEANGGEPVSRDRLQADRALYDRYLAWWNTKRRDFLVAMRDHLRRNGLEDAVVLFTGCPGEPGVPFPSWAPVMVTDRPEAWREVLARPEHATAKGETIQAISLQEVVSRSLYLDALTAPGLTWGGWEVQHARPADDPATYRTVEGVLLTHAFNRLYTVASPATLEAFRTPTGLALVRHYALNENMMFDREDKDILGYFVADMERSGPYCRMSEAVAVARGDPTMIGYLVSNNMGYGFPAYVRSFNANFLALPALSSRVLENAADAPDITVRTIETDGHGTWFALVNTGMGPVNARVMLPGVTVLRECVSGRDIEVQNGAAEASFHPFELKAWLAP